MLHQPHHWQLSQCEADEPRIVNCFMQRSLQMFKMFSKRTESAYTEYHLAPNNPCKLCLQFLNVYIFVLTRVHLQESTFLAISGTRS